MEEIGYGQVRSRVVRPTRRKAQPVEKGAIHYQSREGAISDEQTVRLASVTRREKARLTVEPEEGTMSER